MILLLAASLFFNDPVVPDLPRADAYLVEDDAGAPHLEDRYEVFDLWTAQRACGCWTDEDGRAFALMSLDAILPPLIKDASVTRVEFEEQISVLERDDLKNLTRAISAFAPIASPDGWTKPHQLPRTCRDVRYCEGTNENLIVAAFLPEKSSRWLLATWMLVGGDDREEFRADFEEQFLQKRAWEGKVPPEPDGHSRARRKKSFPTERELLRRDLVHSVTNYPAWRVTDSPGYAVLDELQGHARLIAQITNELVAVRADYARSVPSPLDGSNTLAVARIYAGREAYLNAVGPEMAWSAAYWCAERREIVAYLPDGGEEELLRTLRHEGFHQYLSYAGSMIASAPWFNEGYAEYFEETEGERVEKRIARLHAAAMSQPKALVADLARVLTLDYAEFYDEDSSRCALNYMLAWSIAYFLEKGAPEVRFRPFKNLTRNYMMALLKTRDRRKATTVVFAGETLDLFLSEWLKFYKDL